MPKQNAVQSAARRLLSHRPTSRRAYDDLARRHHEAVLERDHIRHVFESWMPPGHFYSPFPSLDEVERRADSIFGSLEPPLGVDMQHDAQVALFDELAPLTVDMPFTAGESDDYRYYYENDAYSWGDGTTLHAMLRHLKPRRLVEVGSGHSSAMTLDTVEHWLDGKTEIVFVEPYADLLKSLLEPGDDERVTIFEESVLDVDMDVFTSLGPGDVLFIDSTHVVKAGSDVNYLFFEVLPRLAPGVWIHIHDIFFPFEYPAAWVQQGRAWHEIYLLRAFLMGNKAFEIRWFQSYMWALEHDLLESRVPNIARNAGGNIWLEKVAPL